jgi:hypothetical protein
MGEAIRRAASMTAIAMITPARLSAAIANQIVNCFKMSMRANRRFAQVLPLTVTIAWGSLCTPVREQVPRLQP